MTPNLVMAFRVDLDDLANAISSLEYEEIVNLFLRVDEIQCDSVFTDQVYEAFEARWDKQNRES